MASSVASSTSRSRQPRTPPRAVSSANATRATEASPKKQRNPSREAATSASGSRPPRPSVSSSPAFPNLALLAGTVAQPPERRVLADGTTVASFSVRAERSRHGGAPHPKSPDTDAVQTPGAWSTPVRWVNPPAWITELAEGTSVCGYGQVVQRFFRASGATVRRTEVSVCDLAVVGDHRAMRRVRTAARQELAELLE